MLRLIVVAILSLGAASSAFASASLGKQFQIQFGILGTNSSGLYFMEKETNTLPYKLKDTGFRFGVKIVPPDNSTYKYQCVVHLLSAPKVVSGALAKSVDSGTTLVTTDEASAQGEAIQFFWFDAGDPAGEQSVDILVNGKLAKTIHYTVVPEK